MRLQTDFDFVQNEIWKINKKYNIEIFSSLFLKGKAYATEQKIREFKKLLFKGKRVHRATSNKRFDSRSLIGLACRKYEQH